MTPQPDGNEETQNQQDQGNSEDQGQEQQQGAPPESTENAPPKPDAKYSDSDLDHHKGQARKEGRSAVLKSLGFDKVEDAEAWVKERRESDQTERTRAEEVLEIANKRIVRADAREIAAELGVKKNRVDAVIKDFVDLGGIEVNEDGEADREAIKAAISDFTGKFPEFLKGSTGKSPGETENPAAPTGIDAEIAAAVADGNFILADRLHAQKLAARK